MFAQIMTINRNNAKCCLILTLKVYGNKHVATEYPQVKWLIQRVSGWWNKSTLTTKMGIYFTAPQIYTLSHYVVIKFIRHNDNYC